MSAGTEPEAHRGEFTGRHMALVVVAFFGVVIAANLVLAVMANRTWTGLIVANGYVASQEYNGVLADARAQAELGWTASLERRADVVVVTIADKAGVPVEGLEVRAAVGRPTHENEDMELVFEQRPGGLYRADLALAPGDWTVALRALDGTGLRFRRDIRLHVAESAAPGQ